MTEQRFLEMLADEVRRQAKGELQAEPCRVEKNNGITRSAICVSRKEEAIAPTIYVEQLYRSYQEGMPLPELARVVLREYDRFGPGTARMSTDFFSSYEKARPNLKCRLINAGMNRELLRHTPHLAFLDLAVVCYYEVRQEGLPEASILVRENHRLAWGVTEEQLLRDASGNTRRELTPRLSPVWELLRGMAGESRGIPGGFPGAEDPVSLYNLGDPSRGYEAICIWYPDILQSVAAQLGDDFYILPSSVHECLILPDQGQYDLEELSALVREVNESFVAAQEVLSDCAYHYSRAAGRIDGLFLAGEKRE